MNRQWMPEERKVLSSFLDGDRIIRLPAKQKKRLVILRWLVERIEPQRRYSETELNAVIRRHHEDVATIRRELFEFGFMKRKRSVYWRTDCSARNPQNDQDQRLI